MLTLIRGLPGSGKSTLARALFNHTDAAWIEADDFFQRPDGKYEFDPTQLGEAHEHCYQETRAALLKGLDVIVANTFVSERELRPYLKLPGELKLNIAVNIIECHGSSSWKSTHDVPEATIARRRALWWPTDREDIRQTYGV